MTGVVHPVVPMVDVVVGVVILAIAGSVADNCATPSRKLSSWLLVIPCRYCCSCGLGNFWFLATTIGRAGLVVTGLWGLTV